MSRRDDNESLPESGMGGASDAGAHGLHPASAAKVDPQSAPPDAAPGDAAIERRHHRDSDYQGPERRMGGGTKSR